jgi:hypothetical protein
MEYTVTSSSGDEHQVIITPAQPGDEGAYNLSTLGQDGWFCQACGQLLDLKETVGDYAQQSQVEGPASGATHVFLNVQLLEGHRPPH